MKKIVLMAVLLHAINSYSISPETVGILSGLSGLGAAGFSYVQLKNSNYAYLTAAGIGVAISGMVYWLSSQYTPEGKMKRARRIFSKLGSLPSMHVDIDDEEQFLKRVQEYYITNDLWLVDAFRNFTIVANELCAARNLVISSLQEGYSEKLKCDGCSLLEDIDNTYQIITFALKAIKNHKDYLKQLSEYNRREYEKEKMKYNYEKLWKEKIVHTRCCSCDI